MVPVEPWRAGALNSLHLLWNWSATVSHGSAACHPPALPSHVPQGPGQGFRELSL